MCNLLICSLSENLKKWSFSIKIKRFHQCLLLKVAEIQSKFTLALKKPEYIKSQHSGFHAKEELKMKA